MARFTRNRSTHMPLGGAARPYSQKTHWLVITFLFAANVALACTMLYLVLQIDQYNDRNSRKLYLGVSWGLIFPVSFAVIFSALWSFIDSYSEATNETAEKSKVESECTTKKVSSYNSPTQSLTFG